MYILRPINIKDLDSLFELSKIQNFINLPSNIEVLEEKIKMSQKSFENPSPDLERNYYLFVLEDFDSGEIVGTSMIHGKHGTPSEPHYFLHVGSENKYSSTMHLGYIHKTLKLGLETDGWSEVGGLILHPSFRGHKDKLGKQLSFVRFMYIGLFKERFTSIIHTELMPPFDDKGQSPLWEAVGRRFMHMDYNDADQRSRKNKEFILSLFPSDTIYETLLPLDARNSIGEVGETTKPVKRMLENIGFKYVSEVDPFDGGPHYRCPVDDITLINQMEHGTIKLEPLSKDDTTEKLMSVINPNHTFFGFKARVRIEKVRDSNKYVIDKKLGEELGLINGQEISSISF